MNERRTDIFQEARETFFAKKKTTAENRLPNGTALARTSHIPGDGNNLTLGAERKKCQVEKPGIAELQASDGSEYTYR